MPKKEALTLRPRFDKRFVLVLLLPIFAIAVYLMQQSFAVTNNFDPTAEKDVINRTNAHRGTSHKLGSLSASSCLTTVARNWSKSQSSQEFASHNPNLISQIDSTCGGKWSALSENIAKGQTTSVQVFNDWLASSSHHCNIDSGIQNSDGSCRVGYDPMKYIGVGMYANSSGQYTSTMIIAACSTCNSNWTTNPYGSTGDTTTTDSTVKAYFTGDWDGNGSDTPGYAIGAKWYLNNGYDSTADKIFDYGNATDKIVVGDWNGDGIDTPGVVRGNVWYLNNGFDKGHDIPAFAYGNSGDKPVAGDWNRDGKDSPGVVRGNVWYLNNGFDGGHDVPSFAYGNSTDFVVSGDWDGDGDDTPGVIRATAWYLNNLFDGSHDVPTFTYGISGDKFVVGNWNPASDKKVTPGVVRGKTWYLNNLFDGSHDVPTFSFGP